MEKNVQMELSLDEDQLQVITGGCGECDILTDVLNDSKASYNKSRQYIEGSAERRDHQTVKQYASSVAYLGRQVRYWQARLDASRATHTSGQ